MDREIISKLEKEVQRTYSIKTTVFQNGEKVSEEINTHREPCVRISIEMADKILALLKEQEAKQVIRKHCKKEHDDGSIDFFAEWYCPHCNMLILRGFDNPSIKFCYKCGKPILWEGQ